MSKKFFASLFGTLQAIGLIVLKYFVYILSAPIVVVFMIFGVHFVIALFLWVVLIDAAFVSAIVIFCINFFMAFVAIFNAHLWTTMSSMWHWMWSWFANGNVVLWPHFVKAFPPYFVAGLLLILLYNRVKRLDVKLKAIKVNA